MITDDELLEKIRLAEGYLLAHGRLVQCDHVRELYRRYAASRAEVKRLRGLAMRVVADYKAGLMYDENVHALNEAATPD
jgi:hypothetical protein